MTERYIGLAVEPGHPCRSVGAVVEIHYLRPKWWRHPRAYWRWRSQPKERCRVIRADGTGIWVEQA